MSDRFLSTVALCLLALLFQGAATAQPEQGAKRPNIVVLIGDDVGFSDLGSYGGEISTPHLDQLAAQGVRFSNFHVTASCSPSRSILATGVDHHRNGLGNMAIVMPPEQRGQPGYEGVLNDHVVTLPELLRDAGYHSYHVGKWHLGYEGRKLPVYRGYERSIALADTGADNWEQRSYLPTYDKAHWFADGREHHLPDDFYSSKYFVDKAIEFIEADRKDHRPFFLQLGFQAVHMPLQAPREFTAKYHETYSGGWDALREARRERAIAAGVVPPGVAMARMPTTLDWSALDPDERSAMARRMAVYAGMLDAMDHHIGRLMAYLKQIGEFDNTVFVFLSDNGPEPTDPASNLLVRLWILYNYDTDLETLGEKGSYAFYGPSWASASAAPGMFYKFWAGEGGLRVPLIVSWPKALQQGVVHQEFAHLLDLVPTLLDLAGVAHPGTRYRERDVHPLDGRSLLPVLQGRAERSHPPDQAIGYELGGNAALFKGPHKLMRNREPVGDGQWHLYDIMRDPGETRDLRELLPQRFDELLADYRAYEADYGVLPMPEGYFYQDEVRRNYRENVLRPRLRAAAPYALVILLSLTAALMLLRRRGAR